jgi:hypothetical protein
MEIACGDQERVASENRERQRDPQEVEARPD